MSKKRFITSILLSFLILPALVFAEGYRTEVGEGADTIPVVVVKGAPYEMGKAFGALMKEEAQSVIGGFMALARASGDERYANEVLDAAWKSVSPYTSDRFKEELRGIAEGSGIPLDDLIRGHMVPVVSDYSCSGVAVWGKASKNGHLYQIRNLDYDTEGGLQDFPALVVYIPDEGNAHVNITFAGVAGVNTGMNAAHVALTEIGDTPGRDYPFDLDGVHFMTLFRDILYEADDLDQAVQMIQDAKRIKKYHYVVGDGKQKKAVKMRAHAPDLEIWTDNDPKDEQAPKILENVVYHCEGRDPLAWKHLNANLGKYDGDLMVDLSKTVPTKGGNLLDVVYDATELEMWVAYAEKDENAYLRPYVHVRLSDYLPYDAGAGKTKVLAKYPAASE